MISLGEAINAAAPDLKRAEPELLVGTALPPAVVDASLRGGGRRALAGRARPQVI